jgi:hypothetical protein
LRSIRGKRYLIVGLIQTIGQIEFSVSTGRILRDIEAHDLPAVVAQDKHHEK